jgi:hypothetical protein
MSQPMTMRSKVFTKNNTAYCKLISIHKMNFIDWMLQIQVKEAKGAPHISMKKPTSHVEIVDLSCNVIIKSKTSILLSIALEVRTIPMPIG